MTRILIVDDKEENLYFLQVLLTGHDYAVESARDGAEALRMAALNPPDLVISDLLMPVMDGFTLLRDWKADPRLRSAPFIVYTATYTEPANEDLALGLGADAFILKPAEPEEFLARLRQVQATAAAAPNGAKIPDDEKNLLKLYSETLIRKLEDKTLELQQVNRALQIDIARREVAEESIRRLAETQTAILNALPAQIALVDAAGVIVSVNEAWRRFGTSSLPPQLDFCVGKSYLDVCDPARGYSASDARMTAEGIHQVLRGEVKTFAFEYVCHSPIRQCWARLMVTPVSESRAAGAVIMHLDITEKRLAEEAIRRQAHMLNHIGQAVIATDLEGCITYANRFAGEMYGWSPEEMVGRDIMDVTVPETTWLHAAGIMARLRLGETWSGEFLMKRRDGSIFPALVTNSPLLDEGGELIGIIGISIDITERNRAAEELAASEALLRQFVRHSPAAIAMLDRDMRYIQTSERWIQDYHLSGRDIIGESHYDVFPDLPAHWKEINEHVLAGAVRRCDEEPFQRADGSMDWLQWEARPWRKSGGEIGGIIDFTQLITERKRAEETLLRNQALLTMASRLGHLGAWALEMPLLALSWSDEVRAIHETPPDYTPSVEAGIDFYAPESRETIRDAITGCMRDGKPFDVELQIVTATDHRLWTRAIGEARRDSEGTITQVQGAFQDISDRKAVEQELARINRALGMLSKCNEALIRAEKESELLNQICRIAVDNGGYRMAWVGYAQNNERRLIAPQAHAGTEDGYLSEVEISWNENDPLGCGPAGRGVRTGLAVGCPDLGLDPTFSPWLGPARQRGFQAVVYLPLRDAERTFGLLGLYSAAVNPTSSQELTLLQELADDLAFGIINLRAKADQRRMEAAVLKVAAGVSAATGMEFFEQLVRNMAEALGAQAGFVSELLPGDPPSARTIAAVVGGEAMENFEYVIDGTPSENLCASISCVIARGVVEQFPRANRLAALGAQAYAGRRLDSSTGCPLGHLFVVFPHPLEEVEFIVSTMQIFAARAASELERRQTDAHVLQQAALLDVAHEAIVVRDLDDRIIFWNKGAERTYGWTAAEALGRKSAELLRAEPARFQEGAVALLDTGEWRGEMTKVTRDGQEIRVEARWTLVRDAEGKPKSILSINSDITERKRMEEQFFRAQRLESVGTLASGLAHDLNNVLAPILMCSSMLRLGLSPEKMETLISTIESSAARGSQIISKVLTFGRGVDGERIPIKMGEIVEEVLQIASGTFPKNIRTEHHIASNLAEIIGDSTQWHQVLLNLAVNARDAMPDGGVFRITAENLLVDEHYASMIAGLKSGPHIVLEVSDTGSGIPPQVADRIFDPFFTTKMVGKGTGLGLSTVLGIVKSHGGAITVRSQIGSGTTFTLTIPAEGDEAGMKAAGLASAPRAGGGQIILIVDDEENVRNAASAVLELNGYRTLLAADGTQAVAAFAQNIGAIKAVITDITMPYLDGVALVRALQRMQPDLPIIASSGQIESPRAAELKAMGLELILKKPYSSELLLRTLETALDARPGAPKPAARENPC